MNRPLKKTLVIGLLVLLGITLLFARMPRTRYALRSILDVPVALWLKNRILKPTLPSSCEPTESRIHCYRSLVNFWLPEESLSVAGKMITLVTASEIVALEEMENKRPVDEIRFDLTIFILDLYDWEIRNPVDLTSDSTLDEIADADDLYQARRNKISAQLDLVKMLEKYLESRFDKMNRTIAPESKGRLMELRMRYASLAPFRNAIFKQETRASKIPTSNE